MNGRCLNSTNTIGYDGCAKYFLILQKKTGFNNFYNEYEEGF